jgi:transcriptional regulator with XRE-family HTH domain
VALPFCGIVLKAQKPLPPEYPRELKTLGDHLRKKRLALKLTQEEVARILHTNEGCVVYWEKNHKSPSLRFISRIVQFLGYNPYEDISSRSLGERIVIYRQIHGVSQEQLASQLGIDPGTLGRWEKGKSTPWAEKMDVLNSLIHPAFSAAGIAD